MQKELEKVNTLLTKEREAAQAKSVAADKANEAQQVLCMRTLCA